jgi:hypothetical protein
VKWHLSICWDAIFSLGVDWQSIATAAGIFGELKMPKFLTCLNLTKSGIYKGINSLFIALYCPVFSVEPR